MAQPSLPSAPPRKRRPRGGRGGAEPRARIRDREAHVVDLSTRGLAQRAIAAAVGVSQAAVSKILRRADDRALATLHRDRVRQLVRLQRRADHVFGQAQAAWERSCADRERRTQRRMTTPDGRTHTTVALQTEPHAGDPRFLMTMLRVLMETSTAFALRDVDWIGVAEQREAELARAATAPVRPQSGRARADRVGPPSEEAS